MLGSCDTDRVYLACGPTDMRKSIDGLAVLVQLAFDLDPFSNSWFVFCNRGCNKIKLLRWDRNGFWLYYRRLERGRFDWPKGASGKATRLESSPQGVPGTRLVSRRQLMWLLDGLSLEQRKAHPEVDAQVVI